MSSNFYISEEDVGKKCRDEACLKKLSELNPNVEVSLLRYQTSDDFIKQIHGFNVVVITEFYPTNLLINVNNECRNNNIKFIYACNLGLAGYIFSDFGPNHTIFDEFSSTKFSFNIKNITKAEKSLITIDNENGKNNFNIMDGGFIIFEDIERMTELNGKKYKIKYENYESFYIEQDTTKFHDYIGGGKAIRVLNNRTKHYYDFNYGFNKITDTDHQFLVLDAEKEDRSELLFMALLGVKDYFINHNFNLPELNDLA